MDAIALARHGAPLFRVRSAVFSPPTARREVATLATTLSAGLVCADESLIPDRTTRYRVEPALLTSAMTMRTLHKVAFLLEEFSKPSPAQQLVDRFLAGYLVDGESRRSPFEKASAYLMLSNTDPDLEQRAKDFKLMVTQGAEQAVEDADAVIIASRKPGALANERFIRIALQHAPTGAACFVHGALANSLESGRALADGARSRQIA